MSYGNNQNPTTVGYGLHQSQNLFQAYYGDSSTVEKTDGTDNQSDKVAWENDNYTITFDDNKASMKIVNKHTGEIYKVAGDPRLYIGDLDEPGSIEHVGDFYNNGVITLDDGTQIHMNTESVMLRRWVSVKPYASIAWSALEDYVFRHDKKDFPSIVPCIASWT